MVLNAFFAFGQGPEGDEQMKDQPHDEQGGKIVQVGEDKKAADEQAGENDDSHRQDVSFRQQALMTKVGRFVATTHF